MSFPFNPQGRLIIVTTKLFGPSGDTVVRLALDTAATFTIIDPSHLLVIGYESSTSQNRLQIAMGGGVVSIPQIAIAKIEALGQEWLNFSILCHTLPPSTTVDGLLGLNFLRDWMLTVDFRTGQIDLT